MAFYKDINSKTPTERPDVTDVNAVAQSIITLLNTRKRERPFNLGYGIDIEDKLFDLMDDATKLEILSEVFDATNKYEPRAKLRKGLSFVDLFPDEYKAEVNLFYNIEGFGDELFSVTTSLER